MLLSYSGLAQARPKLIKLFAELSVSELPSSEIATWHNHACMLYRISFTGMLIYMYVKGLVDLARTWIDLSTIVL